MTSRFQGELHKLCEEAKWPEVKTLLLTWSSVSPTISTVPSTAGSRNGEIEAIDEYDHEDDDISNDSASAPHKQPLSPSPAKTNHSAAASTSYQRLITQLETREGWNQWTPLMISCVRAPPEIISLLVKFSPKSCSIPDRSGSLPIHFVSCWRRGHDEDSNIAEVIRCLVNAKPETLGMKNQWGQTPLHSAFDSREVLPLAAIRALFGEEGDASSASADSTSDGDNEEHLMNGEGAAAAGMSTVPEVTALDFSGPATSANTNISAHIRRALSIKDRKNRLPLHIAASRGATEPILRLLVRFYPDAALVKVNEDLPIHLLQSWAEEAANPGDKVEGLRNGGNARTGGDFFSAVHAVSAGAVEALLEPFVKAMKAEEDDSEHVGESKRSRAKNDVWNPPFLKNIPRTKVELDIQTERAALSYRSWEETMAQLEAEKEYDFHDDDDDDDNDDDDDYDEENEYDKKTDNDEGDSQLLTEAEGAARAFGSRGAGLPLHIAAEHAVSLSVLRGLCELYPGAAAIPRCCGNVSDDNNGIEGDNGNAGTKMFPVELFESGRAGMEAATFAHQHQLLLQRGDSDPVAIAKSKENFAALLQSFVDRLDLLFAFYPEAVPSNLGQQIPGTACKILLYRRDPARIRRLEELVRQEAADPSLNELSEMARRVWLFLTAFKPPPRDNGNDLDPMDDYGPSVARIILDLTPQALWKLSVVRNRGSGILAKDGGYIFVRTPAGKTLFQEAEDRNPCTTMAQMLKLTGWQSVVTSFLSAVDAMNYTVTCRRTRAAGVRLLREMPVKVPHGQWDMKDNGSSAPTNKCRPPKPWQRIELFVTPECTHTMYVTYRLLVRGPGGGNMTDNSSASTPSTVDSRKRIRDGEEGGLLVVRDDDRRLRPNNTEPWGEAVVASHQVKLPSSSSLRTGVEVRLSFRHKMRHTYGLWYYGPVGGALSVTDVRVRQLVHACDVKGRTPLHVLLSGGDPGMHLGAQMKLLLDAKFGSDRPGDSVGDVPLHFALKCGASEEVLRALIAENPSCLLETDREGRTPLHAAFLLCKDGSPKMGVIRALLMTPGENATKLKDTSGRLPLHIAAERGASEDVLKLLVSSYADGCYRQNTDGDLPLHLLVRSGAATTEAVELLTAPIMDSETICRVPGSGRSINMPLHIASEYQCSYQVLENLLLSYGDAASIPRIEVGEEVARNFPLDLYEKSRQNPSIISSRKRSSAFSDSTEGSLSPRRSGLSGYEETNVPKGGPVWERAKQDVVTADLEMRSDLLFVHNPNLVSSTTGQPYRYEQKRIARLQNLIRREAIQCSEKRSINLYVDLPHVAKMAWCWMCTFTNSRDKNDHYAQSVKVILRGLPTAAVRLLADVEYEKSEPVPNQPIKDCATPLCAAIIQSRIRFVGRFVLHDEVSPLHKSDSCLVIRARDYGAAEEFKRIQSLLNQEEPDIDELAESGSVAAGNSKTLVASKGCVLVDDFVMFARKIGVNESDARKEIRRYLKGAEKSLKAISDGAASNDDEISTIGPIPTIDEDESFDDGDDEATYSSKSIKPKTYEVTREAFHDFCRAYDLADDGSRNVVIKFMMHREQFHREKSSRLLLNLAGTKWPVAPIVDEYDIDRINKPTTNDQIQFDESWSRNDVNLLLDDRDAQYANDILEKNASIHNFSLYKYAVVLPCADRDLAEICMHEELGILQIREYILQVAMSLQCLHSQSIIHGDLKMANVVRFGENLALIDLDSASKFRQRREVASDQIHYIGGGSHKLSSGILPPEMIAKIDLTADYDQLVQYELYWRHVSDDAKDLKLLTPDDIQTITSVVKSLLAKSDSSRKMGSPPGSLRTTMGKSMTGLEDPSKDWKDILTLALVTISYEDLPFSLTCSESLEEFATIWSRLQVNYRLWERIRPRISADGSSAYLVKTFNDLPDDDRKITNEDVQDNNNEVDISMLPYDLIVSNEKVDVWAFGVMLYSLCSGGNLFPTDFNGDLQDVDAYEKLFSWNKKMAEKMLNDNIGDPLAHDLLLHLLVPQRDRSASMDIVLRHPFFGPSSALEAQRILEKHEEQQLMLEETIIVTRMTTATQRRIENSMEKHIKVVFDEEKVVVPTCLIVLPYKLEWSEPDKAMVTPNELNCVSLAVTVGKHLLDINKATARLSFWLMMKKNLADKSGSHFKTQMKSWLKRARSEPCDIVAKEIVDAIGCGMEYSSLCMEILEKGDSISNARAYIKEPMGAARAAIREHTQSLVRCYSSQWLYLVDEVLGVPVVSGDGLNPGDTNEETPYPILIDPSSHLLQGLFLPFMNIAIMAVTAIDRLKGVARLLGIPSSYGIPDSWKETEPGLVHRIEKPSSVAEFAVLHDVIRKQERKAAMRASRLRNTTTNSVGGDLEISSVNTGSRSGFESSVGSTVSSNGIEKAFEMMQLEVFFREYDPMRIFSDLRRVTDGKDNSPAMWTTDAVVTKIQSEVELASVEMRLRELKKEWDRRDKLQHEIVNLTNRVKEIRYPGSSLGRKNKSDRAVMSVGLTRSESQNSAPEMTERRPPESTDVPAAPYQEDYMNPNSALRRQSSAASVTSQKRKKMRKSKEKGKLRFRPYFGAC